MDTHAAESHHAADAHLDGQQAKNARGIKMLLACVVAVSCGTGAVIAAPSLLGLIAGLISGSLTYRLISFLEAPAAELLVGELR